MDQTKLKRESDLHDELPGVFVRRGCRSKLLHSTPPYPAPGTSRYPQYLPVCNPGTSRYLPVLPGTR